MGRRQMGDGRHPGFRAVLRQRSGEAGIKQVRVALPKSLALDPERAQGDDLCEFEESIKPEPNCPESSVIGRAVAHTPILNEPLSGPVYFAKNVRVDPRTGNRIRTLPTLVIPLRGEVAINLRGDSSVRRGKLVNTFANVPDAPVSKFELRLRGGRRGILITNGHLCRRPRGQVADVETDGQNGKRFDRNVRMRTACRKKRRARLSVGKAVWRDGKVTVSGHVNRRARRNVSVAIRCGNTVIARKARPNRRGWWRKTIDTNRRCADASKARVVARYGGGPRVRKDRAIRTVRLA